MDRPLNAGRRNLRTVITTDNGKLDETRTDKRKAPGKDGKRK